MALHPLESLKGRPGHAEQAVLDGLEVLAHDEQLRVGEEVVDVGDAAAQ